MGFAFFYIQSDTLDFDNFSRCVQGQKSRLQVNHCNLLKMAEINLRKSLQFTFVFGAAKQNPHQELETEQVSQIFCTPKSMQVLGNADSRFLKNLSRYFDKLAASFLLFLAGDYLSLIVSLSGGKMKARPGSGALELRTRKKVLLFPRDAFRQPVAERENGDRTCALEKGKQHLYF